MRVAPDGSPVEVYRALPAEPDLSLLRRVVPAGASILDLGSGPGRLANPLAAAGHELTAVDDSPEMLSHVAGATCVRADVWALDLHRRYDVVFALSHLVNASTRTRRQELLAVCRRHVLPDGFVVVQRYRPDWVPRDAVSSIGEVGIDLRILASRGEQFTADVTYSLGERSWTQHFDAAIVDDEELALIANAAGLRVRAVIDTDGAWVLLEPRSQSTRVAAPPSPG